VTHLFASCGKAIAEHGQPALRFGLSCLVLEYSAPGFSDEPLCRAASRSSNREPSPSGMAVPTKLKNRCGAGLRRDARDPPPYILIIKIALVRRLVDKYNELNCNL
jgi:hypothetical protein